MLRAAWVLVPVMLLSCERREDPSVIRSDKTTASASTITVASAAPSAAPPASLSAELAAKQKAIYDELDTLNGFDPDSGLKAGMGGGGGSTGYGGGIENIGAAPSASAGGTGDASAVVARDKWRFKACYTKALAKDPKDGGKVMVKVEVAANGDVKSAKAVTTSASKDLTDCVVAAFLSMKFAESDAGTTTLDVPIVLSK